jgi:phenylalanyl-tRNA synthetase beta chain
MATAGEKATLLNGKTYELTADDIVIVDGKGIVGLGGVMGGGNSEVSDTTKNVVLEVATFDMYAIRKTSMRHGLFTDAVTRFNKGQSPLQNDKVLQFLMDSLRDVSGGAQASDVVDIHSLGDVYQQQSMSGTLKVEADFINARLGLKLAEKEIEQLLRNVQFACFVGEGDTATSFTAPFWRTDIQLPEDIVEEVGRLYGFDKLPRELPVRSITPAPKNPMFELKKTVRSQLSRAGANEVLTYSFVHENTLKKAGQDPSKAYQLSNALSPDLQYYRMSLAPSLLEKIHPNIKSGHDEFALFEIGKGHMKGKEDSDGLPQEFSRVAFVYTSKKPHDGAAYFHARKFLENLLQALGIESVTFVPHSSDMINDNNVYFESSRAARVMVGNTPLGCVGEYKQPVVSNFKLPTYCAGFELNLEALAGATAPRHYRPLSRFPSVTQDITLKVGAGVPVQNVVDTAQETIESEQLSEIAAELNVTDIYQPEGSDTKNITLRLKVASYEKTLTDKDVTSIMDAVASEAATRLGAARV